MAMMSSGGSRAPTPGELAEMFRLPDGVDAAADAEGARWIEDAVSTRPWGELGSLLPVHFQKYARILHPAYLGSGEAETPIGWRDVAMRTGRTVHRLMQFERLAALPENRHTEPAWGRRPSARDVCAIAPTLITILRRHTTTPAAVSLAIWEGYGGLDMVPGFAAVPRMTIPNRAYLLFDGPIESAAGFCRPFWEPPSVWWPKDRAWCVATEIDLDSTYVGASQACIDAILTQPDLESFPAGPGDPITIDADTINPRFAVRS